MSNTTIGLDIAKATFQVHVADETGQEMLRRKLKRSEVVSFFQDSDPQHRGSGACGAAHHWARLLKGLGQ